MQGPGHGAKGVQSKTSWEAALCKTQKLFGLRVRCLSLQVVAGKEP